jgi:hypothetical protein
MIKSIKTILTLTLMVTLIKCGDSNKRQATEQQETIKNPYLSTYSGGYTIEVYGVGDTGYVELYVLADNGIAQWIDLKTAGRKEPEIMTRKYGTWEAKDSYIKISIDGNTGKLVEEYVMRSGVFYNKESSDRYLKRAVY